MHPHSLVRVLACVFIFMMCGCAEDTNSVIVKKAGAIETTTDFKVATTVGNHSYIPLNLDGNPSTHIKTILNVLQQFEAEHRDLEITGWKIEKIQMSHNSTARVHGLWVDHRTRPTEASK